MSGVVRRREPNAWANSSAPKSRPRCESSTRSAPTNSDAYADGISFPPCSQLTSKRLLDGRRGGERRAARERFAELLISPLDLGARRQKPGGLGDAGRERAVPQVVLEQPTGRRVDLAA